MKKLSAAVLVLFSCLLMAITAYAELEPASESFDEGEAYKPYSYQIQMTEGVPSDYEFEFLKEGLFPRGISVSETGLVSGTPIDAGGYSSIRVRITRKSDGETNHFDFSWVIRARAIKVEISDTEYTYEKGVKRKATVKYFDEIGNDITDELKDNASVTYGTERFEEVEDAREYNIRVYVPGCYIVEQTGPDFLIINKVTVNSISISPEQQEAIFSMDSNQEITGVTVDPPEAPYEVEYRLQGTDEYTTEKPKHVGVYFARAFISDPNYQTAISNVATLTVKAEGLKFTVSDYEVYYNGSARWPNVYSDEIDSSHYVVKLVKNGEEFTTDNMPVDAGEYQIKIYFNDNVDDENGVHNDLKVGDINTTVFKIKKAKLSFESDWETKEYDNTSYTPVHLKSVSPDPDTPTDNKYSIKYKKEGSEEEIGEIKDSGKYAVIITVSDNFEIDGEVPQNVEINKKVIKITSDLKTWEYDGQVHIPVLTAEPAVAFTESYKKGTNAPVTSITDAGTYNINVDFGDDNYSISEDSDKQIIVNPKRLEFSVDGNNVPYDGEPHTASLTKHPGVNYTVKYVKNGGTPQDSVTQVGEYDIQIIFDSDNYITDFSGKMTVRLGVRYNLGNSPAAIIYKDTSHDSEWQERAMEALRENRSFSAEYLPKYDDTNYADPRVKYNDIRDIDFDFDEKTLIVNDIDNFEDPGIVVIGGSEEQTIQGTVKRHEIDGVYVIEYDVDGYDEGTIYRFVMLVNRKLGDVNNDNKVNALDANYFDTKNHEAVMTVEEARIWDVNMDKEISKEDGDAIRSRFTTKLIPYYPWLQ